MNRSGSVEALCVGSSRRLGLVLSVVVGLVLVGWASPIALRMRCLLNQSTHSAVASSTPARPRQGLPVLINSVF